MLQSMTRYLPEMPLPPYAFVPGGTQPHPTSDPRGHSFGKQQESVALEPLRWQSCRPYLRGFDLFNHGFYWEAHEVWEGLWHGCGRAGITADFLKGLIRLAAAGVKSRAGSAAGFHSHAVRAEELFAGVLRQLAGASYYLGLDIIALVARAHQLQALPPVEPTHGGEMPVPIIGFHLLPTRDSEATS